MAVTRLNMVLETSLGEVTLSVPALTGIPFRILRFSGNSVHSEGVSKIKCIKAVRTMTGLGLYDAKRLVEHSVDTGAPITSGMVRNGYTLEALRLALRENGAELADVGSDIDDGLVRDLLAVVDRYTR